MKFPLTESDALMGVSAGIKNIKGNEYIIFEPSQIINKSQLSPIVYHGTFEQFSKFDKSKLGSSTGAPSAHEGFFFASNKKVAESYASNMFKRLKDCEEIKEYAFNKIKELTDDSYFDSIFKIYRKEYNEDIHEKWYKLHEMITTCEDYEAGVQELPIAYDSDLDESGNLKEVQLILNNPLIHDMEGNDYRNTSYKELITQAKAKGHDSVIIKNTYDGGDPVGSLELTDIYVVFDESQIVDV